MKDQGKLPNMDEWSRKAYEELNAPLPEFQTPLADAIRKAMPKVNAIVDVTAIARGFAKAAREYQDRMSKLRELEEKDDCCLLSIQALMLGTQMVTFKFQCPHSVNLFAVRLEYCPKCGKKL